MEFPDPIVGIIILVVTRPLKGELGLQLSALSIEKTMSRHKNLILIQSYAITAW
jgi:hypothetical protein